MRTECFMHGTMTRLYRYLSRNTWTLNVWIWGRRSRGSEDDDGDARIYSWIKFNNANWERAFRSLFFHFDQFSGNWEAKPKIMCLHIYMLLHHIWWNSAREPCSIAPPMPHVKKTVIRCDGEVDDGDYYYAVACFSKRARSRRDVCVLSMSKWQGHYQNGNELRKGWFWHHKRSKFRRLPRKICLHIK